MLGRLNHDVTQEAIYDSNNDSVWMKKCTKLSGPYRVNSLYYFIDYHKNAAFFKEYHFQFKQSILQLNNQEEPRKFVMFHLPSAKKPSDIFEGYDFIEHHVSIDAIFGNNSDFFVPCHYTMSHKNRMNSTIIVHGVVIPDSDSHFDWKIVNVNAYEQSEGKKHSIVLTQEQVQKIKKKIHDQALAVLYQIQTYKDRCCFDLNVEFIKLENQLAQQMDVFFKADFPTEENIRTTLSLTQQIKEILQKLHQFLDRNIKKIEDPQVVFLDDIINMLDNALNKKAEKVVKPIQLKHEPELNVVNKQSNSSSFHLSISKKTSNKKVITAEAMMSFASQLIEEIKVCPANSDDNLRKLSGKVLGMQIDCENLFSRNHAILALYVQCDELLTAKKSLLLSINKLRGLHHQLREQKSIIIKALTELQAYNLTLLATQLKTPSPANSSAIVNYQAPKDLQNELVQAMSTDITLVWDTMRELTQLQLISKNLNEDEQRIKKNFLEELHFFEALTASKEQFTHHVTLALCYDCPKIIPHLYEKFQSVCDTPMNCEDFWRKALKAKEQIKNASIVSTRINETAEEMLKVEQFLLKNSANYRMIVVKNNTELGDFLWKMAKNRHIPSLISTILCILIMLFFKTSAHEIGKIAVMPLKRVIGDSPFSANNGTLFGKAQLAPEVDQKNELTRPCRDVSLSALLK